MIITQEDRIKYFPLLDDMGSMKEIYTIQELLARLNYGPIYSVSWRALWLAGVMIHTNEMVKSKVVNYYGNMPVAYKHYTFPCYTADLRFEVPV